MLRQKIEYYIGMYSNPTCMVIFRHTRNIGICFTKDNIWHQWGAPMEDLDDNNWYPSDPLNTQNFSSLSKISAEIAQLYGADVNKKSITTEEFDKILDDLDSKDSNKSFRVIPGGK